MGHESAVRPSPHPRASEYIGALLRARSQRAKAKKLTAMVSHAFFDESGMGLELPVFVMAGFLASEQTWQLFATAWRRELELDPVLPPIHMTYLQARSRKHGFAQIDATEREKRLGRLATIVVDHAVHPVIISVDMAQWKALVLDKICRCKRRFRHPYEFVCQLLSARMIDLGKHLDIDFGTIDFVFDWQSKLGLKTRDTIVNELPGWLERERPDLRPFLGELHWPMDRSRYTPLQAADILAWQFQRFKRGLEIPADAMVLRLSKAARLTTMTNMERLVRNQAEFIMRRKCTCNGLRVR